MSGLLLLSACLAPPQTEPQISEGSVFSLIAARDLYPGVPIAADDLRLIQTPSDTIASSSFQSPEAVIGRLPRSRILENEFVRSERLWSPDHRGTSDAIPPGMRQISIPIADDLRLHITEGTLVDLWARVEETRCSCAQAAKVSGTSSGALLLLLSPEQAATLAWAQDHGEVRIGLRNQLDTVREKVSRNCEDLVTAPVIASTPRD